MSNSSYKSSSNIQRRFGLFSFEVKTATATFWASFRKIWLPVIIPSGNTAQRCHLTQNDENAVFPEWPRKFWNANIVAFRKPP